MEVNVHAIEPCSFVNGPGARFVIWVQGCNLACPGCWNPETWSSRPRKMQDVSGLIAQIASLAEGLDGVTFSGGEPFLQAEPLAELAKAVKKMGLNLFIFTGFQPEELGSSAQQHLLAQTDWLLAGRFEIAKKVQGVPLLGSANQQIHYLSPAAFPLDTVPPQIEISIHPSGQINATGFPDPALIQFMNKL